MQFIGGKMVKELSEMTLEELWRLFPIILKEHNAEYKNWYEIEKEKFIKLIGKNNISRINHIGSSAVKGLVSKPTVDILLELKNKNDFNKISDMILDAGWVLMSSQEEPYKSMVFNKGYTKYGFADKVYHLHIRLVGDWNELYFRDYLIDCKKVAEEYGQLKLKLLDQYKNNRDGYTSAKSDFVLKHTKDARGKYGSRYNVSFI